MSEAHSDFNLQDLMEESHQANLAGSTSKTFTQLLAENPQQKGGLAQLASAEQAALSQSTEAQQPHSQPATSLMPA